MMRVLMLSATAVATLISIPAAAQIQPINKALMRQENSGNPPSWRMVSGATKECLVHKRTKRLQCHTRDEWRAIAAEIDAKQATGTGRR